MLGSAVTSVPGSSGYFLGGVVAYGNDSKTEILRVPKEIIAEKGAVSEETARYMAIGVRDLFGSDISSSVTGIAGPGGGTDSKHAGLVWIGISAEGDTFARKFDFGGCRESVRNSAVNAAMGLISEYVLVRFH
jgi:PncC family amidohydrolase